MFVPLTFVVDEENVDVVILYGMEMLSELHSLHPVVPMDFGKPFFALLTTAAIIFCFPERFCKILLLIRQKFQKFFGGQVRE